jgi:hypothetical protein
MASNLREALRERARQWDAFHEWERRQASPLTLEERIAWYVAASHFVQKLPSAPTVRDLHEKAAHLRDLRASLKHLKRTDRNV